MKRKFIFKDENSSKFWNIACSGKSYTITFGKIGTNGQSQTKEFESEEICQAAAENLIKEKMKKGYIEKTAASDAATNPKTAFDSESVKEELFKSITHDDLSKVQEFVEAGIDLEVRDMYGEMPLIKACDSLKISEYLIRKGSIVDARSKDKFTPLMHAVNRNNMSVVRLLIDHGADVNAKNKWNISPLFMALSCIPLNSEIIKYLIEKGADIHSLTSDKQTPLELLELANDSDLNEFLKTKGIIFPQDEASEAAFKESERFLKIIEKTSGDELKKALFEHFHPWLLTKECEEVFMHLMERLKSCAVDKDTFSLIFQGNGYDGDEEDVSAFFGAPQKIKGETSYDVMRRMHSEIILGDPEGYGESVFYPGGGYDPYDEDDDVIDRFEEFCAAGQNWFVFDKENKNSLGEPSICLWDHGATLADATHYPSQKKKSYGAGGFMFRVLAYLVFIDEKYEEFCYG